MIKIMIADDHILIREGLKKIIGKEMDMSISGEAKNAAEVLSLLKSKSCDVLVLDITMPGKSGLDLLSELKEIAPEVKVLILSMHPEDQFAIRALKLSAYGYITKESAPEELVRAIRKVADGRRFISEDLAEKMATELSSDSEMPGHKTLSDREFQIFQFIAAGKKIGDIAQQLCLSKSTVTTYRHRILEKMYLKSDAEIIHYAMRHNLIT